MEFTTEGQLLITRAGLVASHAATAEAGDQGRGRGLRARLQAFLERERAATAATDRERRIASIRPVPGIRY
jgi:hypothetical protein